MWYNVTVQGFWFFIFRLPAFACNCGRRFQKACIALAFTEGIGSLQSEIQQGMFVYFIWRFYLADTIKYAVDFVGEGVPFPPWMWLFMIYCTAWLKLYFCFVFKICLWVCFVAEFNSLMICFVFQICLWVCFVFQICSASLANLEKGYFCLIWIESAQCRLLSQLRL